MDSDQGGPAQRENPGLVHGEVTKAILAAAIEVHKHLGPGLLESAYESCVARELARAGLRFQRQAELPVTYKGELIDAGFRLDLLVEDVVIVELKSVEKVLPVHEAQLMTYLKLSGKRVGLLINFNVNRLMDGVVRRVL